MITDANAIKAVTYDPPVVSYRAMQEVSLACEAALARRGLRTFSMLEVITMQKMGKAKAVPSTGEIR